MAALLSSRKVLVIEDQFKVLVLVLEAKVLDCFSEIELWHGISSRSTVMRRDAHSFIYLQYTVLFNTHILACIINKIRFQLLFEAVNAVSVMHC